MGKHARKLHGDLIRAARLEQGLAIADVSAGLDVSLSYLAMVERGERKPTAEFIVRVTRHLGMQPTPALEVVKAYLEASSRISIDVPPASAKLEALARLIIGIYS